jgi:beta-lactamase superfamily II metal-dependent hydrolase
VTRRHLRLTGGTVLVTLATTFSPAPVSAVGDDLAIWILSVGQGDAALFRGPCGDFGLVDANNGARSKVVATLDANGGRGRLAWISPSHYDADHLGDVVDVATTSGVSVDAVYDRGGDRNTKDTATYRAYYDWVTATPGLRQSVDIGARFTLCSGADQVTFDVLSAAPDGTAAGGLAVVEENDKGLCLKVQYRDFDMATCGDIAGFSTGDYRDVESRVATTMGNVEVAHVNHHGSRYSSNLTYTLNLRAQAAVVSVGGNSYGHPTSEALGRWTAAGSELYQTGNPDGTQKDGDVLVTTTGVNAFVVRTTALPRVRPYLMDEGVRT